MLLHLALAATQTHELLKNLNPAQEIESSTPQLATAFGNGLLFVAVGPDPCSSPSPFECQNLWFLDQLGTAPVPLLQQGVSGVGPTLEFILDLGNGRALVLSDGVEGTRLLGTDGTLGGTASLPGLNPGPGGDVEGRPIAWSGLGWFIGCTPDAAAPGGRICQLWSTDGSAAGTALAHAFPGGIEDATLFTAGGLLYVSGRVGGSADQELFSLSGPAAAPTSILSMPGLAGPLDPDSGGLAFQGQLWFAGPDLAGGGGRRLWRTDGTPAGTAEVLGGAAAAQVLEPEFVAASDSFLWFGSTTAALGRELWVTDGSGTGTRLVEDIAPGASSGLWNLTGGVSASGALFFNALTGPFSLGRGIYAHDGASSAATLLQANQGLNQLVTPPVPFGSQNFFLGFGGTTGLEPCFSNGTPVGTFMFNSASGSTSGAAVVGYVDPTPDVALGHAWFAGIDPIRGTELWRAQGNSTTVTLEAELLPQSEGLGSFPREFTRLGEQLFFVADDGGSGPELWDTNGTFFGTQPIPNPAQGPITSLGNLVAAGGLIFFTQQGPTGTQLWRTDGSGFGTDQLTTSGSFSPPQAFKPLGALLFYVDTNSRLFRSDGTPQGTFQIDDQVSLGATPQAPGARTLDSAVLGDRLILGATQASGLNLLGLEPAWTDGTGELQLVADVAFGSQSSSPRDFEGLGDAVLFSATRPDVGRELWVTDGTPSGTSLLAELAPGPADGNPRNLTRVGDRVVFIGETAAGETAAWTTDGTSQGTALLVSQPGGIPFGFVQSVETRVLLATFGLPQQQAWLTDGTPGGTAPIDLQAGPDVILSVDTQRLGGSDDLLFRSGSNQGELAIYRSATGTWDLIPSTDPSGIGTQARFYTELNGRLLYQARTPQSGEELFRIFLDDLGASGLDVFGEPCPTPNGPRIGSIGSGSVGETFTLKVDSAPPGAVVSAFIGLGSAPIDLDAGCTSYAANPALLQFLFADGAGAASVAIAIPDVPSLAGITAVAQWLVDDPAGPLFGVFSLSDALEVVLGP